MLAWSLTLLLLVLLVLILVGVARATRGIPVSELLDWKPTLDADERAKAEEDDLRQLTEATRSARARRQGREAE